MIADDVCWFWRFLPDLRFDSRRGELLRGLHTLLRSEFQALRQWMTAAWSSAAVRRHVTHINMHKIYKIHPRIFVVYVMLVLSGLARSCQDVAILAETPRDPQDFSAQSLAGLDDSKPWLRRTLWAQDIDSEPVKHVGKAIPSHPKRQRWNYWATTKMTRMSLRWPLLSRRKNAMRLIQRPKCEKCRPRLRFRLPEDSSHGRDLCPVWAQVCGMDQCFQCQHHLQERWGCQEGLGGTFLPQDRGWTMEKNSWYPGQWGRAPHLPTNALGHGEWW